MSGYHPQARKGVTINNLLRAFTPTDRGDRAGGGRPTKGHHAGRGPPERASTIPAGRYGTRHEFGAAAPFCAQRTPV